MPLSVGGAVAAPVVGGLLGKLFGSGDQDKAIALQQQALQGLQSLNTPTADELKVALQQYKLTGQITPALQSIIQQGQSEMQGVKTDPALMQAQMGALSKLQSLGNGGLQPQDLAALAQVQQQAAGQGQAQQASALQAMQQRGIGGGGNELAARLSAAQGAANTSSQAGLNIQGQAAQRALQAIMQSGQLGGQIQGQQFSQQSQKAQAQDLINRFNAANAQSVQGQNVGSQNQAQYYNVGQNQNIANMNTGVANQQAIQNSQAKQQAYQDALSKASAVYGGQQNLANQYMNQAAQTQQMWGGMGQAAGTGLQGAAMYDAYNKRTAAMNPKSTSSSQSYSSLPSDFNAEDNKTDQYDGMNQS